MGPSSVIYYVAVNKRKENKQESRVLADVVTFPIYTDDGLLVIWTVRSLWDVILENSAQKNSNAQTRIKKWCSFFMKFCWLWCVLSATFAYCTVFNTATTSSKSIMGKPTLCWLICTLTLVHICHIVSPQFFLHSFFLDVSVYRDIHWSMVYMRYWKYWQWYCPGDQILPY